MREGVEVDEGGEGGAAGGTEGGIGVVAHTALVDRTVYALE